MKNKDFSYSFESSETADNIYKKLLRVKGWWTDIYSETIDGSSSKVDDEFTFSAGGGAHFSKQKLVELIPNKRIVWLVTESNLSFLTNNNEWTGTRISFDISPKDDKQKITFTHEGLLPEIECYDSCTSAWSQYLNNLKNKLN